MLRYDAGEVITAMVTPMDKERKVDYNGMEVLAKHLTDNGTDTILVAGTTGESPTLTFEEELELLFFLRFLRQRQRISCIRLPQVRSSSCFPLRRSHRRTPYAQRGIR